MAPVQEVEQDVAQRIASVTQALQAEAAAGPAAAVAPKPARRSTASEGGAGLQQQRRPSASEGGAGVQPQ
jgi:hypothetical protein